jgi:excisionase family DNA binding protein
MAGGSHLTTAEAARRLGVSASTLKRWSDEGLVTSSRTAGGHRRFSRDIIDRFMAQQSTSRSAASNWTGILLNGREMLEVSAELLRARSRLGAWWQVAQELGSALNELGKLWAEGEISILEGHTAAELLSRSLAWCCQAVPVSPSAPTCLLVTADGDDHTLGLSLAELVCREAGWNTCWAGRRSPVHEVQAHIAGGTTQMVLVSASSASTDEERLRQQADSLGSAARAAGVELVLGGSGLWPEEPSYGARLNSFEELSRHLLRDPLDAPVRQHLL